MTEVLLEDFEEFYKERVNEKFYKIKKVSKKYIGDIKDLLIEMKVCMDHFHEAAEDKIDDKAMRSLNLFSDRIKSQIEEVEIPEEVYYENLHDLLRDIKKLFITINEIARKALPKFQKEVQREIKELNYLTRKLQKRQAVLDKFMRKKYMEVKAAEDLLKKLPKLYSLRENIENAKTDLDQFEEEYEEQEQKLEDLNQVLLKLEKNELFTELKKLKDKQFKMRLRIKDDLSFKKALKKFKFELDKETIHVPNLNSGYLRDFLKSPIRTLAAEPKNLPKFNAMLVQLRHSLEENKLNLKSETKEKTIEQINEIFDERAIHDLIEEYRDLKEEIKETQKKIKKAGLADKLESIKNDISVYTARLEHTENDLNRKNKDYLRYLARLKKEREEFQTNAKDMIDEEVKLTITFDI